MKTRLVYGKAVNTGRGTKSAGKNYRVKIPKTDKAHKETLGKNTVKLSPRKRQSSTDQRGDTS